MSAPAKYATPPLGGRHELAQIERVATTLGTPLMPWQRDVAQVASELRPDGSWRYPVVVVTVPRQSGKTTLMRAAMTQRAITRRDHYAFYTAQTGKDAVARWTDLVKILGAHPLLREYTQTRLAAGSPGITFNRTDSKISPFPPTPHSLHGYTPHLVMLDEAFSYTEPQGTDLIGAILPAQVTLIDRQLWIVSTTRGGGR